MSLVVQRLYPVLVQGKFTLILPSARLLKISLAQGEAYTSNNFQNQWGTTETNIEMNMRPMRNFDLSRKA